MPKLLSTLPYTLSSLCEAGGFVTGSKFIWYCNRGVNRDMLPLLLVRSHPELSRFAASRLAAAGFRLRMGDRDKGRHKTSTMKTLEESALFSLVPHHIIRAIFAVSKRTLRPEK
jgi:hypothetical protein